MKNMKKYPIFNFDVNAICGCMEIYPDERSFQKKIAKLLKQRNSNEIIEISEEDREKINYLAILISSFVFNRIADSHYKSLTDEQVKEMKPIIINSIYTAIFNLFENPYMMTSYYDLFVP